jgi:hypothetical protein
VRFAHPRRFRLESVQVKMERESIQWLPGFVRVGQRLRCVQGMSFGVVASIDLVCNYTIGERLLCQGGRGNETEKSQDQQWARRDVFMQKRGYGSHVVITTSAWQSIADIESTSILGRKVAAARPPNNSGMGSFWLIIVARWRQFI